MSDTARLIDAWRTTSAVTNALVEHLPKDLWSVAVPGAPRRTVRMVAAHLHNSRCRWIKALGERHGIVRPPLVDPRRVTRAALLRALPRSAEGMVRLIELGAAHGGRVPRSTWQNFPTDLAHFLSYFVAHEAHHRGQLVLIARQLGHPLPKKVTEGLWQWNGMPGRGAGRSLGTEADGRPAARAFFNIEPEVSGAPAAGSAAGETTYLFDTWLGDDLVRAYPGVLVTTAVRTALLGLEAPTGFEIARARVRSSRFFKKHSPEKLLPPFWSVEVRGRAGIDDMGLGGAGTLVVSRRVLDLLLSFKIGRALFTQHIPQKMLPVPGDHPPEGRPDEGRKRGRR